MLSQAACLRRLEITRDGDPEEDPPTVVKAAEMSAGAPPGFASAAGRLLPVFPALEEAKLEQVSFPFEAPRLKSFDSDVKVEPDELRRRFPRLEHLVCYDDSG